MKTSRKASQFVLVFSILCIGFSILGASVEGRYSKNNGAEEGHPGERVTHWYNIRNDQNCLAEYTLTVTEEWDHYITNDHFLLNPGEDIDIYLTLVIPGDAPAGLHHSVITDVEDLYGCLNTGHPGHDSYFGTDVIPHPKTTDDGGPGLFLVILVITIGTWLLHRYRPWLLPTRYLPLLGIYGYARFDREQILENPSRMIVYTAVKEEPGATQTDIIEETGLPRGAVRYALERLEEFEFIRRGEYNQFYAVGDDYTNGDEANLPALDRQIISAIRDNHLHSQKELAERMSMSGSSLRYHLTRLVRDGYIQAKPWGRIVRYEVDDS